MVQVIVPSVLAAQAKGRHRFEVEAGHLAWGLPGALPLPLAIFGSTSGCGGAGI